MFAGGCFFATTSAVKHRPGVVRGRIAQHLASWDAYLARAVAQGQELGQIDSGTEARRIAFELKAFVHTAESHHQLFGDAGVFVDARDAVRERAGVSTPANRGEGHRPHRLNEGR
ncbi:MAG: TetR family transcriptional regulator C-terminal domain-containing protein [Gaiella sp.]